MSDVHANSVVMNEKTTIFGNDTLVPISLVRWIVGTVIALAVLIAPWLTIMYFKTSKVDSLEERLTILENISIGTKTRLDSMEPLLKETRDNVLKILTTQPNSNNR